jgi:Anti-sigma-K factor rskA
LNHHSVTREGQETAALYALGALSQLEASAFDIHLREGCPACDAELREFEQVVAGLGSVAAPVAPPAYLRDLLTARIEREAAEAPSDSAIVIPFPEQAGGTELRPAQARSSGSGWLPWAIAAALLIGFAYTFVAWRTERRTLQAATARDKNAASEPEEVARLKEELSKERASATELAQINSVLSAPQWRIIPLAGRGPEPGASAKVYWDVQGKRWVVSADLPPPPEGKVYQLWFVTPEAKISAGLINLHDDGHGFIVVQVPPNINEVTAAAITLEPEGGSPQPTTPIYLFGNA